MTGAVDDEESATCGCEDGLVALGLGGCELPAVGFFKGNGLFRFSLAQAFLWVKLKFMKSEGDKEHTRFPFAYGTSTSAGLRPRSSMPSPLSLCCFKIFRTQSRGGAGDVSWASEGLWLNKRPRNVVPGGVERRLRVED
jgi:hypothetical protein